MTVAKSTSLQLSTELSNLAEVGLMLVDTRTGEILDLSPLKRKPKGRGAVRHHRTARHRKTTRRQADTESVVLLIALSAGTLALCLLAT